MLTTENDPEVVVVLFGGKIVSSRTDRDGLKVCIRGNGFFIWVNSESPDVKIKEVTVPDTHQPNCGTCGGTITGGSCERCGADNIPDKNTKPSKAASA